MSTEIDWQAWYHRAHADFCKVESRNYVLKQRIKAQAAVLRGLINWYVDDGEIRSDADLHYWVEDADLHYWVEEARKALGEE